MGEINFNFNAAVQAAHQMEEIMNRMNTEVISDFAEVMQELSGSWNGEAGNCFRELMDREAMQLEQTAQLLDYTESCLQDAICKARRTEEKTKEIAKLRTY